MCHSRVLPSALALCLLAGCQWVPKTQLTQCQSQARLAAEQNRAQQAELANLRAHSRRVEDQLAQAEDALAGQYDRGKSASRGGHGSNARGRMADLARKQSAFQYDPQTGSCRYDAELLFNPGSADLKTEGRDLNVTIVGHADDKALSRQGTKEHFSSNEHLSVSRALAVQEYLAKLGVPAARIGVSGFGSAAPIVANNSTDNRRRNRRAEIFVTAPDTPVIGRTGGNRVY
jgi:flagellar motor protein MotB